MSDRESLFQGHHQWQDGDWIECPRCERQSYDVGSCELCGNLGILDENGDRLHCDCRADDWVEGDNNAIRCERCGGYAGEPGTSIHLTQATGRGCAKHGVPDCDDCFVEACLDG